ncbi:hypothetical protein LDO26_15795 [Luteimonas sp. BDR2-5]|uniref:hypothetical protein n=1 Tax=Proluteimonas luteida TaxID=2878685 RepID=UPI001E621DC0|nr:hypothetical protein [Luteimonas sp. BDR2-5]MCD9029656.1 hypothetical protein [Luteimonas sp. BDR2-5]
MRTALPFAAMLALTLAACDAARPGTDATLPADAAGATVQPAATADDAPASGRLGPDAVWQGTPDACRDQAGPPDDCLLDAMRTGGATAAAVAAAQRLAAEGNPGYIDGWREIDGVGAASLVYPFRANTNQGLWLVDADGRAVDVDQDVLPKTAQTQDDIREFLEAHPDVMPFAPAQADGSETLPDDGVRLVFATPMRSCHACEQAGTLRVGYDFDAARRFSGQQVLDLR